MDLKFCPCWLKIRSVRICGEPCPIRSKVPWTRPLIYLSDQVGPWDFKFAGDVRLAETARRGRVFQPIFQPLCLQGFGINIFSTLILIVPLFCNSTCWTSGDALPTFIISELKAVFFVVTIFSLAGCQPQESNDTPNSNGHSFGSDEPFIETEGPETARIGDMAF